MSPKADWTLRLDGRAEQAELVQRPEGCYVHIQGTVIGPLELTDAEIHPVYEPSLHHPTAPVVHHPRYATKIVVEFTVRDLTLRKEDV